MIDTGWIKLHRKETQNAYYKKSQYVHLWHHILVCANHAEKDFFWNGEVKKIMPGQLLTGRKKLSEETGISESTVEDILKFFERQQQIQQQKTTKYRLLTVVNWNEYQGVRQQKQQQGNNKPTTGQQQADTNKNVKNDKNVRIKEKNTDGFLKFYSAYPKKVAKVEAEKSFNKINPDDELLDKIILAVSKQSQTDQWKKDGGKYIPMPSTWLNQRRWEDEVESFGKSKIDCRTVSTDFSSDMALMKKQMAAVTENTIIEEIKHD
jgi:hypothetical protein